MNAIPPTLPDEKLQQAKQIVDALRKEIGKAILGQQAVIDEVLIGLLADAHVLIEGVPGLGKTLLVKALARTFNGQTRRIQFTPDLMPSDVVGHTVFDAATARFVSRQGPVFTNLLLADEINRAPGTTVPRYRCSKSNAVGRWPVPSLSVPFPWHPRGH
jgi:MoxR-like ATPase